MWITIFFFFGGGGKCNDFVNLGGVGHQAWCKLNRGFSAWPTSQQGTDTLLQLIGLRAKGFWWENSSKSTPSKAFMLNPFSNKKEFFLPCILFMLLPSPRVGAHVASFIKSWISFNTTWSAVSIFSIDYQLPVHAVCKQTWVNLHTERPKMSQIATKSLLCHKPRSLDMV